MNIGFQKNKEGKCSYCGGHHNDQTYHSSKIGALDVANRDNQSHDTPSQQANVGKVKNRMAMKMQGGNKGNKMPDMTPWESQSRKKRNAHYPKTLFK